MRIRTGLSRTILIAVGLIVSTAQMTSASIIGGRVVSIPRPELEKLYEEADVVAFVKILSGDTEGYADTVYKAAVINAYKGAKKGGTVFFGPYVSYGIGSEYLVFLKNSGEKLGAIAVKGQETRQVNYGDTPEYTRVMYGGYGILRVSYECGLGAGAAHWNCDYAVDAGKVILPKTLKPAREDEGSDTAFVQKHAFEAYLDNLKKK